MKGKTFSVSKKRALSIIKTWGFWYYYDRIGGHDDLYLIVDGKRRWLNSQFSREEELILSLDDKEKVEFEIESYDIDSTLELHKSLMRESR